MKKRIVKIALCCLVIILVGLLEACSATKRTPITTPEELLGEISRSSDGAVLYVGDIDFTPASGVANSFSRIDLKKSVTIKGAYSDRSAVFTNAGFDLIGSKVAGEVLSCTFEDIRFDGVTDTWAISANDWECCSLDGINLIDEPAEAQYAVHFAGNINAVFSDCVFENYMYENGPAMWAYYGDYTGNPELSAMLGDYSNCRLDIMLENCVMQNNAALFGGGAVYIDGNDNVVFRAENCVFSSNSTGSGTFSEGGGACRFSYTDACFKNCVFSENIANRHYEGMDDNAYYMSDADHTQGGAIYSYYGRLTAADCVFSSNRASLGGAVNVIDTDTQLDSCVFDANSAVPEHSGICEDIGPWTGMGMGGAVYVTSDPSSPVRIYDSILSDNRAFYAYGSIYGFYTEQYSDLMPLGLGSIDLYGCTVKDNHCDTLYDYSSAEIYPWASHPGNILDIEYLSLHGCVFTDESIDRDFMCSEEPSAENGYNYIASPLANGAAAFEAEDIDVPAKVENAWYDGRRSLDEQSKVQRMSGIWIAPVSLLVVLAVIAAALYSKNRQAEAEAAKIPVSSNTTRVVLDAEEIEALRKNVRLRQLLTDREMEVMCEYVSGSSRSALAEKLCISEATAKTHISNIYSKLGVGSKQGLMEELKKL